MHVSVVNRVFACLCIYMVAIILVQCTRPKATEEVNLFLPVPLGSSVLFHSRDAISTSTSILESRVCDPMQGFESLQGFSQGIDHLKSLLPAAMMQAQVEMVGAWVQSGKSESQVLFILPKFQKEYSVLWNNIQTNYSVTTLSYDGEDVYRLTNKESKSVFYLASPSPYLLVSRSKIVIEKSLRQISNGSSLHTHPSFEHVWRATDQKSDISLYLHLPTMDNVLGVYYDDLRFLPSIGGWILIDLNINDDKIFVSGFMDKSPSNVNFGFLASSANEQASKFARFVPSNVAFGLSLQVPSVFTLRQSVQDYYAMHVATEQLQKKIDPTSPSLEIDYDDALGWISGEVALFYTPPNGAEPNMHTNAIFEVSDETEANQKLYELSEINQTEKYKGYEIYRIRYNHVFSNYLGGLFDGLDKPYYSFINDDYVLMSRSLRQLKTILNSIRSKNTLIEQPIIRQDNSQLNTAASIEIYFNGEGLVDILNATSTRPIIYDEKPFKNLSYNHIQIYEREGGVFFSGFINHAKSEQGNVQKVWQTTLQAEASTPPFLFSNHITGEKDIAIQDRTGRLYLYSNIKKLHWSKDLKAQIRSSIHEVDILRNRKYQLLFSTDKGIICLDRKKRNVQGFPIRLPSKATSPVSVFDYDKNRKYRMLIATEDKNIRMYDQKGKRVKGFTFTKSKGTVYSAPHHFRFAKKDYIVFDDATGTVYILDRRGRARVDVDRSVDFSDVNQIYGISGRSLQSSYWVGITESSQRARIATDGMVSLNKIPDIDSDKKVFFHKDASREVIYNNGTLRVSGSTPFIHTFGSAMEEDFSVQYYRGRPYYCYLNKETNLLYILNRNGKLISGFPLRSTSLPTIGDIDKNKKMNVVCTFQEQLINYEVKDLNKVE